MRHCALNVVLYGPRSKRWAMTEMHSSSVARSADRFELGASALTWDGTSLTIDVDEHAAPIPLPLKGRIRVRPHHVTDRVALLDPAARHRWWPIAPAAHIEVEMTTPALAWNGEAYLDTNNGDEPLAAAFANWDWSRMHQADRSLILYDMRLRGGGEHLIAMDIDRQGRLATLPEQPRAALAGTGWRVPRTVRSVTPDAARVLKTFEDTPFYNRSLIQSDLGEGPIQGVHESLDLDRYTSPWVQTLLPFKMRREWA